MPDQLNTLTAKFMKIYRLYALTRAPRASLRRGGEEWLPHGATEPIIGLQALPRIRPPRRPRPVRATPSIASSLAMHPARLTARLHALRRVSNFIS